MRESDPVLRPACMDCGKPYSEFRLDTTLPNDQWLMINGANRFNGLLCANCMVRRASELPGIIAARMVLEFADLSICAPAWRDRPTGPGMWACALDDDVRAPFMWVALKLDADDIARGVPFHTQRVYGPIPEDSQ